MEGIIHPLISTSISQSSEKIVESAIELSSSLASSKLIPQTALEETISYISNEYGKDLVSKTLTKTVPENIPKLIPQAAVKETIDIIGKEEGKDIVSKFLAKSATENIPKLIPQAALKESIDILGEEEGKDILSKILTKSATENIPKIIPKASNTALTGVSSTAVTEGVKAGVKESSLLTQSLQTFSENSGKIGLLSLASIPAELAALYLSRQLGADKSLSEGLGFAAGLTTSVGVGCTAGPIGAAVGGGTYLLGKGIGELTSYLFSNKNPSSSAPSNNDGPQDNSLIENTQRQIYNLISQRYHRYPEIFQEKYLSYFADEIHKLIKKNYSKKPLTDSLVEEFYSCALNVLIGINTINIIETIGSYFPDSNYVDSLRKFGDYVNRIKELVKKSDFPSQLGKLLTQIANTLRNRGSLQDIDFNEFLTFLVLKIMDYVKKDFVGRVIEFIEKFIDDLCNDLKNLKIKWELEILNKLINFLIGKGFDVTVQEIIDRCQ